MSRDLRSMLLGSLWSWDLDTDLDEWRRVTTDRNVFTVQQLLQDLPTAYDCSSVDTDLSEAKAAARRDASGRTRSSASDSLVSLAGAFIRESGSPNRTSGILSTSEGPLRLWGLRSVVSTGSLFLVGALSAQYQRGVWTYTIERAHAWNVDPPAALPRWDTQPRGACALRMVITQSVLAGLEDAARGEDEQTGVSTLRRLVTPERDEIDWAMSPRVRSEALDWFTWLLGPDDPNYDDRVHGGTSVDLWGDEVESDGLILDREPDALASHDEGVVIVLPEPRMLKGHRQAEVYASEVLRALGFADAHCTPMGADGGVDVVGTGIVAQVKMEAMPTGRERLQSLFGIAAVEEARAVFFSLAGYTEPARLWGERAGIALFEFAFDGSIEAANDAASRLLSTAPHGGADFR